MNRFYSAWSVGSGCNKVYNISQHQVPNIHSIINEMCFIGDHVYSDDVICCMVWASSSRKNKRKTRPRRKKPREGSSHLTKFFKVPNSWFKLRPMAYQRKTWDREDRQRRHMVRDVDAERPSWLLNLNEHRDIDDERPAWLLQLTGENIPLQRRPRRFRRECAQRAAKT